MESLVFLSGPITGLSHEESTDWRTYVAEKLPPHIKTLSPMRGKRYLKREKSIGDSYEERPLSSRKGITTRDRFDVTRCDLVLVNLLGTSKVSIGTVMEIAWADLLRKPIVIMMEETNPHWHAMIREVAGFVVSDLDHAIEIIKAVLDPDVDNTEKTVA